MEQVIVGVAHQDHLYPRIVEFLAQRYPSASSAMLEILPDWREYKGFFPDLARCLEARGARIIAGDLKYWDVFEPAQSSKLERLVDDDKELKTMARIAGAAVDGRLLKDRNESMNSVYQQEHPDLTVVGARHAKYLKQKNPGARFIYISSTNIVRRMTGMDIQWRADETIRFPQSTEDFMYQSLGLLSIGAGLAWGANIVPLGLAALAAPGAYAAYSVSRVMKSSKGKEDGLKAAEGCGALIGASMTGALALGAGYAIGAALNSMM
ncbi:MAG TPA: hypothetical protein VJH22_07700 [Candidatus Nanoarchaeia archaeon]|nr:hypothetical protein [Candidatus Nanoarchaeia archaeon]